MPFRLALLLSGLSAALLLGHESAAWHIGPAKVTDGDTVRIRLESFRLKGVRAPEGRTAPGEGATRFLREAVIGARWVACRETGALTFSRYEAFCYTLPGTDLGAALIGAGLACPATQGRYRVEEYLRIRPAVPPPADCGN